MDNTDFKEEIAMIHKRYPDARVEVVSDNGADYNGKIGFAFHVHALGTIFRTKPVFLKAGTNFQRKDAKAGINQLLLKMHYYENPQKDNHLLSGEIRKNLKKQTKS